MAGSARAAARRALAHPAAPRARPPRRAPRARPPRPAPPPQNPARKADDGWTSCKYRGQLLSLHRPQLEDLIASGLGNGGPGGPGSPPRSASRARPRAASARDSDDGGGGDSDDDGGSVGGGRSRGGSTARRAWAAAASPRRASGGRPRAQIPRAPLPGLGLLWVQCDEARCGKWRRVRARDAPGDDVPWACAMNPDLRWASCDVPQAVPDDEIDRQLEALGGPLPGPEGGAAHADACVRPPLDDCTDADFEDDVCAFLAGAGEAEAARALRGGRVQLAGTPLDLFGLYREVVACGGLHRCDAAAAAGGRVLDWAGRVFPRLRNFAPTARAAAAGAQLATHYRRFLLAYEEEHADTDLPPEAAGGGGRGDALAFLADVASQGDPPLPDRATASAPGGWHPKRGLSTADDDAASPVPKRRRSAAGAAAIAAALRRLEALPGRPAPGDLLLVPDPADLNRHWPVAVASLRDLPAAVVAGGASVRGGRHFPQPLDAAVDGGKVDDALPVVALCGADLGWVEAAATRPFTASVAAAAAAAVAPAARRESGDPDADAADADCARALKVAAQLARAGAAGKAAAAAAAHAAGAAAAAARLLALEGRLPLDGAMSGAAFDFWAAWRRAVARAESGAELAPHVLALAHQLKPASLAAAASGGGLLVAAVRAALDLPPAPSPLPVAPVADAGGDAKPLAAKPPRPPPAAAAGIPAVDAAITAIEDAVDWARLGGVRPGAAAAAAAPRAAPTVPVPSPAALATCPSLPNLHHCGSATNLGRGELLGHAAPAAAAAPAADGEPDSPSAGSPTAADSARPPAPPPRTPGGGAPAGTGGAGASPPSPAATAALAPPPRARGAFAPPPDTVSVGSADAAPAGTDLLESLRSMAESEARAGGP